MNRRTRNAVFSMAKHVASAWLTSMLHHAKAQSARSGTAVTKISHPLRQGDGSR